MLSFLHNLSLINNYITFNIKKLRLANRSKEGPINFINPFNADNL